MNIKIPVKVGQTVFALDSINMSVKRIVVDTISVVVSASKTYLYVYEKGCCKGYRAENCFTSLENLMKK